MRPGRPSFTAQIVAAARAVYTEAPAPLAVVHDPLAAGLLAEPLRTVARALVALPGGPSVVHRIGSRVSWGLAATVPLRTAAIDEALRREAAAGVAQLVLLGAGLDARAWRLPELRDTVVFEVDHPSTQAHKRASVAREATLARHVRYVPVDFERDSLARALRDAGLDTTAPSVWVWEGVTMYLPHEAIAHTIGAVAELAAPGSLLLTTYLPLAHGTPFSRRLGAGLALAIGERLRGAIAPATLATLLAERGFVVERDEDARDWSARYWPESERARVGVWERLAVARRAPPPGPGGAGAGPREPASRPA
ncbi:MAG: class I SAM-dependent methyltransferase [Polyangiaceae bacterium]|nr:class I SAM-dependent methyltransferase [Polyangiaceae bacterium]